MNLYKNESIHNQIYNYSHMIKFVVCLQIDRESYFGGLSSRSVSMKCKWEPHSYQTTATLNRSILNGL